MLYTFKKYLDYFSKISIEIKYLVIIIMIALIIDMEISNEAHLIDKYISNDIGIIIFTLVSLTYLVSQQFILSYSHKKQFQIQIESSSFRIIQRLINFMILVLIICFLTIVFQIIFSRYYDTIFLLLVLVVTNSITIISMSYISIKFFSWYRRRHLIILIFGIMSVTYAITAFVTILFMGTMLIGQPEKIDANYDVVLPKIKQGSIILLLNYLYFYLANVSYALTWIIAALLLKDYAKKLGKLKFWTILSLPLLFYFSQLLITEFGLFVPQEVSDRFSFLIWFSFLYTLSIPVAGILFSLPFFLVIKKTNTGKPLEHFLKILAYGLILYSASGSATVYHTPYPPFGLSTVSMIGPSSYLIAMGIYYSAILIARNRTIEYQMMKAEKYSEFFANIGSAELEKAMTEIVEEIGRKLPSDKEDVELDPASVDKEIIEYLKKYRGKKTKND
jgi:hypothetical protein